MLTVILCGSIGFLVGIALSFRAPPEYRTPIGTGFFSLVCGSVCGIFCGVVLADMAPRHNVAYGPVALVAMHSSDGISGAFVWGSGSIASQVAYNFLYRNSDGSFTPGQVPADSHVRIIEDASLQAVGYWSTTYEEPLPASNWDMWVLGARDHISIVKQEFRVPVGTVVQRINVN